jgi:hypothetical protein
MRLWVGGWVGGWVGVGVSIRPPRRRLDSCRLARCSPS